MAEKLYDHDGQRQYVYNDFLNTLERAAHNQVTVEQDPATATFYAALHDKLLEDGDTGLAVPISFCVYTRKYSKAPEQINIVRSAMLFFSDLRGYDVPGDYASSRRLIQEVADVYTKVTSETATPEEEKLWEPIREALFFKDLHTTPPARYGPSEVFMKADPGRFPHGVEVLDIGCSIGQGLRALALKNELDAKGIAVFPAVTILDRNDQIDMECTLAYDDIINLPSPFRSGVGVDKVELLDPKTGLVDPEIRQYARANLKLGERRSQRQMGIYDRLENEHPTNVTFMRADFGNRRSIGQLKRRLQGKRFDMVIANTVWYQMPPDERAVAFKALPDFLKPNGVAVSQDSMEVVDGELELDPARWIQTEKGSMPWTAAIFDMQRADNGWQPMLHSGESRFDKDLRLGVGTMAIRGTDMTLHERLTWRTRTD